ncbi:hypothetical protein QJS64_19185 (plasmid) [Paraclostridium bifermentans]|uniref:CopG family transcriptional regulator n=1 Tax=Paraclostridium bifermentans TaxID=1490 RepID=A0ABY8R8F3_PARBF|nr:hypothetical protein QJS64_19185 [Paraclostridium bifermentans]
MAREIRVTFTDKEEDLYNFIKEKSSASNFIKDLARLEKERQENYKNSLVEGNLEKLAEKLANKLGKVELKEESTITAENKTDEYDFKIDDIIKK